MSKIKNKKYLEVLQYFAKTKNISKEELKEQLIFVFTKSFEKDNFRKHFEKNEQEEEEIEILPYKVIVNIDLDKPILSIKKEFIVSNKEDILPEEVNIKIDIEDERIKDSNLKEGEIFIEEISLSSLDNSKSQKIKQLLIQKTSESEKKKLYDQFKNQKNKIVTAKIHKKNIEKGYYILDYKNASIFLSKKDTTFLDDFEEGDFIKVLVSDVQEESKDAQIIGTRTSEIFVESLLKEEINEIIDGTITIVQIVRIPGLKTKVVLKSNNPSVEPIGSIIGPKAQRIKKIIDEINGERIELVKYHENFENFLVNLFFPSRILGYKISKEDPKEILLLMNEKDFLNSVGKKGSNIKLISKILNSRIEIINYEDPKKDSIEWKKINIVNENNSWKQNNFRNNDFLNENINLEEISEEIDLDEYNLYGDDELSIVYDKEKNKN